MSRKKIYVTDAEFEAIIYAVDFMADSANGASDEAGARINKRIKQLIKLYTKIKKVHHDT